MSVLLSWSSVLFLLVFNSALSQPECSFSYEYLDREQMDVGLIELRNLMVNRTYNIQLELICKESLTAEENIGSIKIAGEESEIYENILSDHPVKLVVNFPKYITQIPRVRSVIIDGQKACTSSDLFDGVKLIIVLQYKLNTSRRDASKPSSHSTNTNETSKSSILLTSSRDDVKHSCGKRIVTTKDLILNSYSTSLGEWPWHAAIYHRKPRQRAYACGGTLISEYHIITASHCTSEVNGYVLAPDILLIQLGAYDLDLLSSESLQEHNVAKIIPHPEYNRFNHRNDISVIKLQTKVNFTPYVQPACLYNRQDTSSFPAKNLVGNVVGWGRNLEGQLSSTLKAANMPFVTFQDCLDSNRDVFGKFLSDGMFCAGNKNGTNVCDGDSGGGIFINIDNVWYLTGITAFTALNSLKECSMKDYAVFTDITKNINWIEGITGPLDYEQKVPDKVEVPVGNISTKNDFSSTFELPSNIKSLLLESIPIISQWLPNGTSIENNYGNFWQNAFKDFKHPDRQQYHQMTTKRHKYREKSRRNYENDY